MRVEVRPLKEDEPLVESYIFYSELIKNGGDEILANYIFNHATRMDLESLKSRKWLWGCIIIVAALRMMAQQKKRYPNGLCPRWYLPTDYSREVLGGEASVLVVVKPYFAEDRYGGDLGTFKACERVYISINDSEIHWLLAVIDFNQKVVHCLDSDDGKTSTRPNLARKVADFGDEVFEYLFKEDHQRRIKNFCNLRAEWAPQQENGWDCGMHVIKFFEFMNLNGDDKFEVTIVELGDRRFMDAC